MKNGYMFFLHLGAVTHFARIALLIAAIAFFNTDNFYLKIWIAVFAAICFVPSVLHAPSDKDAMRATKQFYDEFKERLEETRHSHSIQSVKIVNAYKVCGNMKMCRSVGSDVIYPNLISAALAPAPEKGKLTLYVEEFTLLKKSDLRQFECLVGASDIELESKFEESDETVVTLTIKCPLYPDGVSMIMRNDFHYREFVEAAEGLSYTN